MNCPNCNQPQPENAATCNNCGASLVTPASQAPAEGEYREVVYAPDNVQFNNPQSSVTYAKVSYAGFWKRFAAIILDGIILGLLGWLVSLPFGGQGLRDSWWFSTALGWLYYSLMESSARQATLGKQALGIKVTDLQGRHIDFGRATLRYFAKFLSAVTLGIGFLMAAFTEKKQALHDLVASTLVINR